MKTLGCVTVFVGGDFVMFKRVDRLNEICQPLDVNPLCKLIFFRHT